LEKKLKAKGVKAKEMPYRLQEEYDKSNGTLKLVFAVEKEIPVRDTLFHGRTNFCVDFRFCRTCYESISTVTCYCCLIVIWMDSFSHDFTSL
jgi:hypothetical protein